MSYLVPSRVTASGKPLERDTAPGEGEILLRPGGEPPMLWPMVFICAAASWGTRSRRYAPQPVKKLAQAEAAVQARAAG